MHVKVTDQALKFYLIAARLDETSLPVTIGTQLTHKPSVQAAMLLLKWDWKTELHELRERLSTSEKSMWLLDVFSKLMYFKIITLYEYKHFFK